MFLQLLKPNGRRIFLFLFIISCFFFCRVQPLTSYTVERSVELTSSLTLQNRLFQQDTFEVSSLSTTLNSEGQNCHGTTCLMHFKNSPQVILSSTSTGNIVLIKSLALKSLFQRRIQERARAPPLFWNHRGKKAGRVSKTNRPLPPPTPLARSLDPPLFLSSFPLYVWTIFCGGTLLLVFYSDDPKKRFGWGFNGKDSNSLFFQSINFFVTWI